MRPILFAAILSGCYSQLEAIRAQTAGVIPCRERELIIRDVTGENFESEWTAECRGRLWTCHAGIAEGRCSEQSPPSAAPPSKAWHE